MMKIIGKLYVININAGFHRRMVKRDSDIIYIQSVRGFGEMKNE